MSSLPTPQQALLREIADLRRRVARGETQELNMGTTGAASFLDLNDVPDSYSGFGSTFVRVSGAGTALEFGTVNWVDIFGKPSVFAPSTHGSMHWSNGADPIGTVTPTANAIPYADSNGHLDEWISVATDSIRGRAAFTQSDFITNDGTVSLGISVPRFSGTPIAGQLAQWTGSGTIGNSGYASSAVTRYTGSPVTGRYTYWTADGTVAASDFGTADLPRYTGTPLAGAMTYWTANGTISSAGYAIGEVARYSGTPIAGNVAYWTADGTVAAAPFDTTDVARYSGAPTTGAMTYWTANGTIAAAPFGTADITRYSGTPVAGELAQWTGVGTIGNSGYAGSAVARYSGAPTPGAIAYWVANGTVTEAPFGTADVVLHGGTPSIASFANATHNHEDAADGGQLTTAALSDLSSLVQTTGDQSIAGIKTFSSRVEAYNFLSHLIVLNDDQAVFLAAPDDVPNRGILVVTTLNQNSEWGLVHYRTDGAAQRVLMLGGGDVEVSGSALGGTTGNDGKLTVSSILNSGVYIENRLGGSRGVRVTVLAGS